MKVYHFMDNQRGHLHFCHSADSGLFSIKTNRGGEQGKKLCDSIRRKIKRYAELRQTKKAFSTWLQDWKEITVF